MKIRIAAFGFRSIPMTDGSAGADKFALEMLPRLVKKGYEVVAYNRVYPDQKELFSSFQGVRIINIHTVNKSGFDTLIHSLKCTFHIVFHNTADIVHIQNGGNSIWTFFLRLCGKITVISQDGMDWKRDKWPWYGKIYLRVSTFITAHVANYVIFDNLFVKKFAEKKYRRKYDFIPFGSEVPDFPETNIISKYQLVSHEYYLFIGRFIPDKGLHYLIPAFLKSGINKKLVIVGGPPNYSKYGLDIKAYESEKVIFPGYIYGDDVNTLIKNCYCYVQPSDVEGLSPVLLQVMGIGAPVLCSDIEENIFIVQNDGVSFKHSDITDLKDKLLYCENNPLMIQEKAAAGIRRITQEYNWDDITDRHIKIFTR